MKNIDKIISDYKSLRKMYPDRWLIDCENEKDINCVIKMASKARNLKGKKHPHQHRIQNRTLDAFFNKII